MAAAVPPRRLFFVRLRRDVSCNLPAPRSRNLLKRPPLAVEHGLLPGEPLPTEHGHIDIPRIDLHAVADSPGALGCDQGAAASQKWVVASLAGRVWFKIGRRIISTGF